MKYVLIFLLFFIIGSSSYIYLPIRSALFEGNSWYAADFAGVLKHISAYYIRQGHKVEILNFSSILLNHNLHALFLLLKAQLPLPVLIFVPFGIFFLFKRQPEFLLLTIIIFFSDFFYCLFINPMGINEKQVGIVGFGMIILWIGEGLKGIFYNIHHYNLFKMPCVKRMFPESVTLSIANICRQKCFNSHIKGFFFRQLPVNILSKKIIFIIIFSFIPLRIFSLNFSLFDHKNYYYPRSFALNLCDEFPFKSLFFSYNDAYINSVLYLNVVENMRCDLKHIIVPLLVFPQYKNLLDDSGADSANLEILEVIKKTVENSKNCVHIFFEPAKLFYGLFNLKIENFTLRYLPDVIMESQDPYIHFGQILKKDPSMCLNKETSMTYSFILNQFGNFKTDGREFKEARKYYKLALIMDPENYKVWNNLGVMDDLEGNPDTAILHTKRAISINPSYAVAHGNLGLYLLKAGRLDSAVTFFKKSLNINKKYLKAQKNLAEAYFKNKQYLLSLKAWERVLELDPKSVIAKMNIENIKSVMAK
ncbi:MAG: hypothetical protein SV062_09415 [Thermodesulfobacteriota bacterium]|nr:hypothetical protein [Thermodesulfobacteriota bacterium]